MPVQPFTETNVEFTPRPADEQVVHDAEIARRRAALEAEGVAGRVVHANPGREVNWTVARPGGQTFIPDLIVLGAGALVERLVEVETASTVNATELEQWRLYAAGKAPLTLVVPTGRADEAKRLLEGAGLAEKVALETY